MPYKHIDIDAVMAAMTLEERISMVSGQDFWRTRDIPRLGVPDTMMCDGPTGLRKSLDSTLGTVTSVPSTCFPTACSLASTWNRDVVEQVGRAIGVECRAEGVSLLLAPGNNIKRSPLCGRNFEYYSEDPCAGAELAAAYIKGVQSQGVGATLKHYCANNQETFRFSVDEIIDERTLREIYLAAFEFVVKTTQPWSIMSSYNRVNGEYVVSSRRLLTDVLRKEWGFKGFVVSDWGAVDDRAAAIEAGMDLEMPGTHGATEKHLASLAKAGKLNLDALNVCVRRILEFADRAAETLAAGPLRWEIAAHHELARTAASEGIVLLKNDDCVLPLCATKRIAVIGEFAAKPRSQGGGSSFVNATMTSVPLEELQKAGAMVEYAAGFHLAAGKRDEELEAAAVALAARSDVALLFIGLSEADESEGFDRAHMRLPAHQNSLVEAVTAANPQTVVVLTTASAVEMPWVDSVKGIVAAYLPGQAGGAALADVLLGTVCPSGKLSETFPKRLEDTPCYLNFPGKETALYGERVYVGYRHYDALSLDVLFPFGHGLSYTTFEYSAPRVEKAAYVDNEVVEAEVTVRNTGKVAGAEVVQLYVCDAESTIDRPEKELRGFEKVHLAPGESKTLRFALDRRAFAYYDVGRKDWVVEEGDFLLLFASSSRDVRGEVHVRMTPAVAPPPPELNTNTLIGDILRCPQLQHMSKKLRRDFSTANMGENFVRMFQSMELMAPLRMKVTLAEGTVNWDDIDNLVKECKEAIGTA